MTQDKAAVTDLEKSIETYRYLIRQLCNENTDFYRAIERRNKRLAQAREVLEAINEWFGERLEGKKTTNSEKALFKKTFHILSVLEEW